MTALPIIGLAITAIDKTISTISVLRKSSKANQEIDNVLKSTNKKLRSTRKTIEGLRGIAVTDPMVFSLIKEKTRDVDGIRGDLKQLHKKMDDMWGPWKWRCAPNHMDQLKDIERRISEIQPQIENIYFFIVGVSRQEVHSRRHRGWRENRPDRHFVQCLKLSRDDYEILHRYSLDGDVPIAQSLCNAGTMLDVKEGDQGKAVRFYVMAIQLCHPKAARVLGLMHEFDSVDGANVNDAVRYFEMAVDFGDNFALISLAKLYGTGKLGSGRKAQALKYYERAHKCGYDDDSIVGVGCKIFVAGTEEERDRASGLFTSIAASATINAEAVMVFEPYSCHSGLPSGQAIYAEMERFIDHVLNGIDGYLRNNKSFLSKMGSFLHSASIGIPGFLQYEMSMFYRHDDRNHVYWMRKSADLGYGLAQCELAQICEFGWGMVKNVDRAFRYYRLAAKQGEEFAQASVARMYIKGTDVSRDLNRATFYVRLLEKSQSEYAKKKASALRRWLKSAAVPE